VRYKLDQEALDNVSIYLNLALEAF